LAPAACDATPPAVAPTAPQAAARTALRSSRARPGPLAAPCLLPSTPPPSAAPALAQAAPSLLRPPATAPCSPGCPHPARCASSACAPPPLGVSTRGLGGPAAQVERSREAARANPADTARNDRAAALGLLSRWRLSDHCGTPLECPHVAWATCPLPASKETLHPGAYTPRPLSRSPRKRCES
jgi:hypothetical protein